MGYEDRRIEAEGGGYVDRMNEVEGGEKDRRKL